MREEIEKIANICFIHLMETEDGEPFEFLEKLNQEYSNYKFMTDDKDKIIVLEL